MSEPNNPFTVEEKAKLKTLCLEIGMLFEKHNPPPRVAMSAMINYMLNIIVREMRVSPEQALDMLRADLDKMIRSE